MDESQRILQWLAGDDTGMSSESIAFAAGGITPKRGYSAPHDPADLGRCLRLLDQFPEWTADRWQKPLAASCFQWAALIERWDEVKESFLGEAGLHWEKSKSAPRTYDLMSKIRGAAWAANQEYDVELYKSGHLRSASRKRPAA